MQPIVERIFVATQGGAPMASTGEVTAIPAGGLQGDRYMERKGYWTRIDECEVTLVEGEALDQIAAQTGISIANGEHRRNIVTRGVELHQLRGKQFSIGEALLEYDRPRPPCRYVESITEPGMTRALGGGRGGICARVVKAGVIRVNDPIRVLDSA